MAANPTWSVRHRCGHHTDWDLSHKPPDKRVGFATWLAQRDCSRCWWTKRRDPKRQTRTIARPPQKRREQTLTETWETTTGMPDLEGSDQAIAWARHIRHRLLQTARRGLGIGPATEREFAFAYAKPARQILSAGWWIDHRHVAPAELHRLLAVSSSGHPATPQKDR